MAPARCRGRWKLSSSGPPHRLPLGPVMRILAMLLAGLLLRILAALLLARLLRVLTAVLVLAPRILSRLLIAITARILLILITHEVVLRNMPPDRIISRYPIRSIVFSARCRTRISRGLDALDLCSAIVFRPCERHVHTNEAAFSRCA